MSYESNHLEFQASPSMSRGLIAIIGINVLLFILTRFPVLENIAAQYFWLHCDQPMLWQSLTYMFFHANSTHLFFNMISLFFFGPSVSMGFHGDKNFISYYLTCGIGGAFFSYIFAFFVGSGPILGASGAIFGLYYACYRFFPDAIVHVWMIFPVKLKYLLIILGGFSVVMLFDGGESDNIAHITHLGGLLTGILWFRYADSFIIIRKAWERKKQERWVVEDETLRADVDRILEKISQVGMGKLTSKEKATLKEASRRFKK